MWGTYKKQTLKIGKYYRVVNAKEKKKNSRLRGIRSTERVCKQFPVGQSRPH